MCDNRRAYSNQKNTWSCKSNLNMNNWDPYPELQNPNNCYGNTPSVPNGNNTDVKEGYCNCSNNDCGMYKNCPNRLDSNYVPLQESVSLGGIRFSNPGRMIAMARAGMSGAELFENDPRCNPTFKYNDLRQTWAPQKPYGWGN